MKVPPGIGRQAVLLTNLCFNPMRMSFDMDLP
jgi:hypothetical protein